MRRSALNRQIGRNIRRLRLARGWSQEEFAARSGVHRTYVGSVERGERNVTVDTLERLAAALAVEIGSLIEAHPSEERTRTS